MGTEELSMIEFDVWLDEQLKQKRLTKRQLAYRAGIEPSTITHYSAFKRSPTLRTLLAILDALDMTLEIKAK